MIKINSNTGICPECLQDTRQMRRVLKEKPKEGNTMTLDDVTLILKGCEKCRTLFYRQYRKRIGLCETCGQPILIHPLCSACRILIGPGHPDTWTVDVGKYKLCPQCINMWQSIPIDIMFHHAFKRFCQSLGRPFNIDTTGYDVWMKGDKAKDWTNELINREIKSLK